MSTKKRTINLLIPFCCDDNDVDVDKKDCLDFLTGKYKEDALRCL